MNLFDLAKLKMDPMLRYAKPIDPPTNKFEYKFSFEIRPSEGFPAAIEDIVRTIESNEGWTEDLALNRQVVEFNQADWPLCFVPQKNIGPIEAPRRAIGLELARRWFTEKLHRFCGHQMMYVHWTRELDWRWRP